MPLPGGPQSASVGISLIAPKQLSAGSLPRAWIRERAEAADAVANTDIAAVPAGVAATRRHNVADAPSMNAPRRPTGINAWMLMLC